MALNDLDGRGKETEFLAHPVLQMTQEREVQTRLSSRSENDEGRRTNTNLSDVLHVQPRTAIGLCRRDARLLGDFPFKEFIQTLG